MCLVFSLKDVFFERCFNTLVLYIKPYKRTTIDTCNYKYHSSVLYATNHQIFVFTTSYVLSLFSMFNRIQVTVVSR